MHRDSEVCSGLSAEVIAQMTGAHITTARRWKRGGPMPEPVRRLVQLISTPGDLSMISAAWKGWYIVGRHLCGPDGYTFEPREILALPFIHTQVRSLQSRLRFDAQADWIDQRYVEPEETEAPDQKRA